MPKSQARALQAGDVKGAIALYGERAEPSVIASQE
jgi:hypothetical protein